MNESSEILSPELFIVVLIMIMIIFGAFGGCVNYLITKQKANTRKHETNRVSLLYSIVLGIGASFLVPLFLSLLSSDIIDRVEGAHTDFLIFGSLCLIAGISSNSFIQVITGSVIKKLSKTMNIEENDLVNSKVKPAQNGISADNNVNTGTVSG